MHVVNAFKLGHGHKYRQDRVCSQGIKTELYDTDSTWINWNRGPLLSRALVTVSVVSLSLLWTQLCDV